MLVIFSIALSACTKSEISIGLEGNYIAEVSVIKRSYLSNEANSDDQVHGMYIRGDSAVGWGSISAFQYTRELRIFKLQGVYYLKQNRFIYDSVFYGSSHLPLSIDHGRTHYSSPEGNSFNNGSPIFKIDFDNKTLEGYWVIGDNLYQGSLGSISNGIIEQAHFKLKKK